VLGHSYYSLGPERTRLIRGLRAQHAFTLRDIRLPNPLHQAVSWMSQLRESSSAVSQFQRLSSAVLQELTRGGRL